MARSHGVIKVGVWEPGNDFRLLRKDSQRAYMMLVSQPTINNLGVLDYTPERWIQYAADDTTRALNRALRELNETDFVIVDARTRELLVRTFIRHDKIGEQPNLVKSAGRQLREVESIHLRYVLATNYPWLVGQGESPCGVTLEPLSEVLWKPPAEGVTEGVRVRARRAPTTPTPTPTPTPTENCSANDSPEVQDPATNGTVDFNNISIDLEHAIAKVCSLKRADDNTGKVIRSMFAGKLPAAAFYAAHETATAKGGDVGYAIGALKNMVDEGTYR